MCTLGKYKLIENNNFDQYLQAIGVNFVMRKMLALATPVTEVTIEGCDFAITTRTTFRTKEIKFRLSEEVDEITGDGRHCKSKFVMHKANGFRQSQTWDGKEATIERVYEFGEKMTMTLKFGDTVCTRVYTRLIPSMVGTYKLTSSANYDPYIQALGVDLEMRKLAVTANPTTEIKKGDDEFIMTTSTSFKTTEIKFKLMEEFDEITADGRKCRSFFILADDTTLVHIQRFNGKETRIERAFEGSKMIEELQIGNVYCTRVHTKIW